MRYLVYGGVGIGIVFIIAFLLYQRAFAPTQSFLPEGQLREPDPAEVIDPADMEVTTKATSLSIPWEIVWLPNDAILITERPGQLLQITPDGAERRTDVPRVAALGEGGLLGMALHPNYTENKWLYLYRTYQENGRLNEVVRYTYIYETHELTEPVIIIDGIPGARFHDGGRIHFGPDGYLYITTGDAGVPRLSQDRGSLAGKILRLTDDGSIPDSNPFNTAVYSYGHRNPQGMAWDVQGRLWTTDHGRSGALSGMDELNLVQTGDNHGWPDIEGDESATGMQNPVVHSGPDETWAPSGMTAVENTLFFAGLRGARLYQADIQPDDTVSLQTYFANEFGRIRTVAHGPDDALYLLTSNTDGRGTATSDDDRLIRIPLSLITETE